MFFVNSLHGVDYKIKPWTTRQEIAYCLFVNEETPVKDIFNLLIDISPSPKDLSEQDMVYLLYQTYINSTGGDINMKFTCSACGQVNENSVQIGDYLTYDISEKKIIDGEYTLIVIGNDITIYDVDGNELSEEEMEEYVEDMDLLVAQKLEKIKKETTVTIDAELICAICHNTDHHDLSDMYKTDLAKSTIQSLYQLGHDFTYYGHMSLDDYYNMIPFERDIYFNIIEKTREEEAKLNR